MILGGKTHLVWVTRPEITSLKEIKGKTIGITRPGNDVRGMLVPVATSDGMDSNCVNAPHPHAALLLIDFLLSAEGQKIYADKLFYTSATRKVSYEKWYPDKRMTTAEYEQRSEKWRKLLRKISQK